MKHSRRSFGACLMSDGKVMVCGGMGSDGKRLSGVECYDPSTNAWADLPPLLQVRLHTSCQSLTEIFADAEMLDVGVHSRVRSLGVRGWRTVGSQSAAARATLCWRPRTITSRRATR